MAQASVLCPTLLQRVQFITHSTDVQDLLQAQYLSGSWCLDQVTHSGSLLGVLVVMGKWRGKGKETDAQIESVITKKVHPREGPISSDFRCDSCLLNSCTDPLKAAAVSSTISLPVLDVVGP